MTIQQNAIENVRGNVLSNVGNGSLILPKSQFYYKPAGIDNLDPFLTINGIRVAPKFRYKLGDANATNLVPWGYGETLTRVSVATPPTYNAGSPGLGVNDDSCKFNASDYYKKTSAASSQFTTGDIVVEVIFRFNTVATQYLMSTLGSNGLSIYQGVNSRIYINLDDSGGSVGSYSAASLTTNTWFRCVVFVNRDEASVNGSRWYINGVESGTGADLSAISGSLSDSNFGIGATQSGSSPTDSTIAYLAAWEYPSWFKAGAAGLAEWAVVNAERQAKWQGTHPYRFTQSTKNLLADGDMEAVGVASWTAADSVLTKDTTAPLYQGTQHLRITSTGATFWATQTCLTLGYKYRITGAARSVSGSAIPKIRDASIQYDWVGTTSTDWQEFDFEFIPNSTQLLLGSNSASGVVDFDNVKVTLVGCPATTSSRAFSAYLDKVESGYRKLYYMSSNHLRMCHRKTISGASFRGLLPETQATNLFPYSEDFSNWDLIEAGTVVVDNAEVCPDGRTVMASIAGDSDDEQHGIEEVVTLTAVTHAYSGFCKPGNKSWIYVNVSTIANCDCYFDITNGVKGTQGAGCVGYIEPDPFVNGSYRWCIVFTGPAAAHTLQVSPAQADGDNDFIGDGSTVNTYVWGAQIEAGDYMTSPIITAGASATRLFDDLEFVAGANIGGEDIKKGTIVYDALYSNRDVVGATYHILLSDGGSANDRIFTGIDPAGDKARLYTIENANPANNIYPDIVDMADGEAHEIRCLWGETCSVYTDGANAIPTPSLVMPDGLDLAQLGSIGTSSSAANCLIRNIRFYDVQTLKGN